MLHSGTRMKIQIIIIKFKDKAGIILYFIIVNNYKENTKTNVLVL